jgi:serine/threonine protein kinase
MVFQSFEILLGMLRFTLGPLPSAWKARYNDDYASHDLRGQELPDMWFDDSVPLEWPLAPLVDKRTSHLSLDKKAQLLHLLQAMLVFDPSQRITAQEVLDHPFIRETPPNGDRSFIERVELCLTQQAPTLACLTLKSSLRVSGVALVLLN